MTRILPAALLPLLLHACAPAASSPTQGPATPVSVVGASTGILIQFDEGGEGATRLLEASPEEVWAILPDVYQRLQIAAQVEDAEARSFGTRRFTRRRIGGRPADDFVRCGTRGGAGSASVSTYRIRLSILSSVASAPDGGTQLTTAVGGSATTVEGTSTAAVPCVSTGELERTIHTLVTERLAG